MANQEKYTKFAMKPKFKDGCPFLKEFFVVEKRKTEIWMNKPVYHGQAILDLSRMLMHEFHYDYMQPKYGCKVKLCYMNPDSFVYEIETEEFLRDIAEDVETKSDINRYSKDHNRPLPIGKKMVIDIMKDERGGEITTEFVALGIEMHSYSKDRQKVGR